MSKAHAHEHVHKTHPDIIHRLKRAEGHLKKVISMIEHGESCTVVARQLQGVYKAIGNAKGIFITDHIEHCLDDKLIDADAKTQRHTLSEFKEITKYL